MNLGRTFLIGLIFTGFFSVNSFAKDMNSLQMTKKLVGFYAGGNVSESLTSIAVDKDGNNYAVGYVSGTSELIGAGGFQSAYGGGESDGILIKYDKDGNKIWSTYFGGSGKDIIRRIKYTNDDKLLIVGTTFSSNAIASAGAMQVALAGESDAFIACFKNDGTRLWSSYFGGSSFDYGADIDIDANKNIIVGGTTRSSGLTSDDVHQKTFGGVADGFILKLDADGKKSWMTYFGGEEADSLTGVGIQNGYYIVVCGSTLSKKKIATDGCYQDSTGGLSDAFVGAFLTNGDILWASYLGGNRDDYANDVACDGRGNVIVTGATQSNTIFASDSAYQPFISGMRFGAAFISKLNAFGELEYSTYYGSSKDFDSGNSVICDSSNSYIVTGSTRSPGTTIPISSPGAHQLNIAGEYDAFVVKFNERNSRVWGTYYGGTKNDFGNAVAIDANNDVIIAGTTASPDGISSNNSLNTADDGFIAKLSGVGNTVFYVYTNDQSIYPLKLTLSYRASGNTYTEKFTAIVNDSLTPIIYDTKKEQGSYRIKVEQHLRDNYLPYEGTVADRLTLMGLTMLRLSFTRNNYKLDSNSASSIQFYSSNNGIYGSNIPENRGGLFWPRGTKNQYIFGGGMWFGAQKINPNDGELRKYAIMTYNPNNGNSWVVPGRYEDARPYEGSMRDLYKTILSSNYNKDGNAIADPSGNDKWALWLTSSSYDLSKYGAYVFDTLKRNKTAYPLGPKYFSDEDIFSVYKDNELDFYDGGMTLRKLQGYPLGLQFEQNIYTWKSGALKDAMIVSYKIINFSKDTLKNCWAAPVVDYDMMTSSAGTVGSENDRGRYYKTDESLGFGVGWTDTDKGELEKGFGYIGFSLLQTPAVEFSGYLKKNKRFYPLNEQLKLKTFRNWTIADDKATDEEMYYFLSGEMQDGDNGPGDKRALLGTGPFHMLPGDTAKVVLLLNFAAPAYGGEADGTDEDMATLIAQKKAIDYFWNRYLTGIEEDYVINYASNVQVFPNPAVKELNIKFSLNDRAIISADIFDLNGVSKVKFFTNEYFTEGEYMASADVTDLPTGTYYVYLRAGNQIIVSKFVKSK